MPCDDAEFVDPASLPKRTRFEILVPLVLTDEQLRAVASVCRGRERARVRKPASEAELREWVTSEVAVSLSALMHEVDR